MKTVTVRIGGSRRKPNGWLHVIIPGFAYNERLTPKLARAALRIANMSEGEVWDTFPAHGDLIGYRVYPHTVRRLVKRDGVEK